MVTRKTKMNKLYILIFGLLIGFNLQAEEPVCPLMLEDEIDEEEFSEFAGKKTFMCCSTCVKRFDKSPKYYIKALREHAVTKGLPAHHFFPQFKDMDLKDVKLMDQRFCPVRSGALVGPGSPSVEYKGKKVFFFKSSDMRKWNKNPEKYFASAIKKEILPQFKNDETNYDHYTDLLH